MAQNEVLLRVEGLSVAYGHINALKGVDLEVHRGEIVVLIGANGAGKTTLLETSLGINTPQSGKILFKDRPIGGVPADRNVRAGLCLVPEGRGENRSGSAGDLLKLPGQYLRPAELKLQRQATNLGEPVLDGDRSWRGGLLQDDFVRPVGRQSPDHPQESDAP